MKFIKFILNLPWTAIGLGLAVFSFPTSVKVHQDAIVFRAKSFWWHPAKGVRALTLGNAILLGTNMLENDLEHEYIHVEQHMREPLVHPVLALIELRRHGYRYSKYEKEAYQKAGNAFISKTHKKL